MANPTKEQTVRRALEALANHYDVATARFATLGGAGYELAVWTALDVPREHCWLIERDQQQARRLIPRARPAHVYVGELRDFPRMFRSVAPDGTLDVFHWDLCETMEPNARELRQVFPVIAGSTSRCLLVTAADQRGNRSLDEADLIDAWWTWLLGSAEAHRAFRAHLVEEHDRAQRRGWTEAASANAATRELSLFLHLLLVLCDFQWEEEAVMRGRAMGLAALDRTRAAAARRMPIDVTRAFAGGREPSVTFVPDELVRSVYYSRVDGVVGRSFRMRTTGLHLARLGDPIPIRDAAARIASLITATPLQIFAPGSHGRIRTITIRGQQRKEFTMPRGQAPVPAADAAQATSPAAAGPLPYPSHPPSKRLCDEVVAFITRLVQRVRALGLPAESVAPLARTAIESLQKLVELDGHVCTAEDAARATERVRELLASARSALAAGVPPAAGASDGATPSAVEPMPGASGAAPPAAASPSKKRRRRLTIDDRTALTVRLLRVKRVAPDRYAAELAAVKEETGLSGHAIGACLARTNGKFRDGFVRRVLQSLSGDAREAQAAELEAWGFGEASKLLRAARSER